MLRKIISENAVSMILPRNIMPIFSHFKFITRQQSSFPPPAKLVAKKPNNHYRFFSTSVKIPTAHKKMNTPSVIAWDLDDTIWDCLPHYRKCINATRIHMKMESWLSSDFEKFGYKSIEHMFNFMFDDKSEIAQQHFYKTFETTKPEPELLKPDVIEVLQKIHELNIKMVVVSNLEEIFAIKLLEYFDIKKYFSAIVVKREGEYLKPDPRALLSALNKINMLPGSHVWMFGDSLRYDVQCASSASCTAVLYNNPSNNAEKHKYPIEPHAIVNSHRELLNLIHTIIEEKALSERVERHAALKKDLEEAYKAQGKYGY